MTSFTTPATLQNAPLPVQIRMAAAWTAFMFLYVYVDVLNFYKPGVVGGILDGIVFEFDVSPALLTVFLVTVSIPAVMVALSVTLPPRPNRVVNLVVASILMPYSLFNAVGETWDWAAFYAVSIGVELVLLAFIFRSAWTWPRNTPSENSSSASHAIR